MNSGLISTSLVLAGVCMWTLDPSAALSFSPESHVTAPPRANFAVGRYAVSPLRPIAPCKTSVGHQRGWIHPLRHPIHLRYLDRAEADMNAAINLARDLPRRTQS